MNIKTFAAAAAIAMSPVVASATVLDFTDTSSYDISQSASSASGTILGSVVWEVTGVPDGSLTYSNYDGPNGATGGLAEDNDGIGIVDDELSFTDPMEYFHLNFSEAVAVTGFHFLDLFIADDEEERETVLVWFGSSAVGVADLMIEAEALAGQDGGYLFAAIETVIGTDFTFGIAEPNDAQGKSDYSLAGVNVVPLPAAGFLLLGGLGGLVAMKRRKKAA